MNSYLHFFLLLILSFGCHQTGNQVQSEMPSPPVDLPVGGACENCELLFEGMPEQLYPEDTLPGWSTADKKMIISGTIFRNDGITPAEGVVLYIYHTDVNGKYSPAPGQSTGLKHGQYRGWIRTDSTGRYHFYTFKPASYPGTTIEAHIHPIVKEPGLTTYYIDEYLFDDDPYLTATIRNRTGQRGGSGIISLAENEEGILIGNRDITLGLNVPGYPKR